MRELSISLEQAQKIINANSIEELDNIKSSLSNQLEHLPADINNSTLINIRMLSNNEWNRYLENGTLNGSITANNVNVWHMPKYNQWYDFVTCNNRYGTTRTGNFNQQFIGELTSNNTSNKIERLDKNTYKCWIAVFCHYKNENEYLSDSLYHKENTTLNYSLVCKTIDANLNNMLDKNQTTYTTEQYNIAYYWGGIGSTAYTYLTITYINAFRPCFSYKDNNKSNNIYY